MSRRVTLIQGVLTLIAIALVATLFLGGFVGGTNRDEPASPNTPGPATPSPLATGARMPGVPEVPVDEHETFPEEPAQNADRQLDYEAAGAPQVSFLPSEGGLAAYASQVVEWERCAEGSGQCATVRVPLDWDDPAGDAIEIAVRRVVDGDSSRGPLFVNPGGPGFGGQDFAQQIAGRWTNYDTVGWDPRGTGESTTVVCGTLEETDEIFELDGSPDDAAEDRALQEGATDFAQQCRDSSGDLLDHLTTIDVVRDLDLIRHLLGAEKLNYVGVSYGTYVGAMYAELFPNSVGRLVLDAAVDITGEDETPQTQGFERAMGNFTAWCAESDLCSLGDDQQEITDVIDTFLTELDTAPLEVGDRILTQTMAATGIALYLYEDEEAYRTLDVVIANGLAGDGEALLYSADLLNGRGPAAYDTIAYAFPAMICADWADEGVAPVPQEWRDTFEVAPLMAPHMGMSYNCQLWTADSAPQIRITAEGAPPILVVGTTGDSATPYEQAQSMAEQLESGTLLTLDGAGHGAVTGDNSCIAEAVDGFLYDGEAPEDGTTCS